MGLKRMNNDGKNQGINTLDSKRPKGKVQTGKQADCMLVNAYMFNIQYPIVLTFNCIQ